MYETGVERYIEVSERVGKQVRDAHIVGIGDINRRTEDA